MFVYMKSFLLYFFSYRPRFGQKKNAILTGGTDKAKVRAKIKA